MELLLDESTKFETFSQLHLNSIFFPLIIFIIFTIIINKYFDDRKKFLTVFFISLIPAICVLLRMVIHIIDGSFTMKEELPLHLCRLLALVYPIIIWYKNEKWINTFYYLVLAGTLQAVITPDVKFGPMHYSFFLYFILHNILIFLPFLTVYLMKMIPDLNDLKFAFIVGNIYMIGTLIINFLLGSNYFYTLHKPPGKSLLDLLGPWPIYIISSEVLALILFFLAWLLVKKKRKSS